MQAAECEPFCSDFNSDFIHILQTNTGLQTPAQGPQI